MDIQESPGLPRRFESTHAPLSHSRRLMGKLGPVVGIPGRSVNRIRDQLTVCDPVAAQLVRHDLPGLATVLIWQSLKKTPCCPAVSSCLKKHIDHCAVLIHRTPEIVLPPANLHEDLINEEGIATALRLSPESPGVLGSKVDAPQTNGLVADGDAALGQ